MNWQTESLQGRKNNILIVYNFTETSDHQTDKDSFVNFCSSVFNCNVKISKVLCLGKKIANKHRPVLLGFEHYDDKVSILSRAHLLHHNDQYSDVFIVPDRTKFEREKHKKLVAELKERRTKGESGLIIRNGAIVARLPQPGSNPTTNVTNHPTQSS